MDYRSQFLITNSAEKLNMSSIATQIDLEMGEEQIEKRIKKNRKKLAELQEKLYAEDRRSVLVVFQAMDAAGKDSTIREVFTGLNPQGTGFYSFKSPSKEELAHDFLWRCNKKLPPKGHINVFNRSHYEETLVVRVHPGYLMGQRLPEIKSPADADQAFWNARFEMINEWEERIQKNGTTIIKFFLNVGLDEQKSRFLRRLNLPHKNWKFNSGDLKERALWDNYMAAYADMMPKTSQSHAPWYCIPADDKPTMRLIVSEIVKDILKGMKPTYPEVTEEFLAEKKEALKMLGEE
ncbi:MAG: PPK2 family polyphosphate kinase [Flavobacteriales bacterium]